MCILKEIFSGKWAVIELQSVVYSSVLPFVLRSEMKLRGKSVHSWCDRSSDQSFMVNPLSYFTFQPVLHDRVNKGRGMCYPVCEMVHIK